MKSLGQAGAVVAMLTFASGAMAATHIGTPAELPPDDFAGRQFVDSAGCVFIRATVDGAVTWVPRLTGERTVLCGFEPTFTEGAVVAEGSLPTPAPDLPPKVDAETAEALAEAEATPAPAPTTAPAARPEPIVVAEAAPAPVRKSAPVRRVTKPRYEGVPAGYRPVWTDDRLNPHRGPRTAAGDAAMARVWTNEVPMRLAGD